MLRGKYIHGNCMEYLPGYPDQYFDLAIVDPPYGIGEDGRKADSRIYKKNDKRNGRPLVVEKPSYEKATGYDNQQPPQEYFDQLFRVSKHQIIWGCNYLKFDQKNSSTGRIFWDKVNGDCDQSDGELAWTSLFSSVRQIEYMWNGFLQGESLRHPRRAQGNQALKEKRIHPNQKPVLLFQWCLRLKQVEKGWRILDTHGGSGPVAVACEIEGFEYEVIEIEESFHRQGMKRLKQKTHLPLFQ